MTATAHSTSSATLSKIGLPACTCRLGSDFTTREEACQMIASGLSAPLSITNKNGETGYYWLSVLRDGDEVVGYRLTSDDEAGVMYDLPASLDSCECWDHMRNRHACKHLRAVTALKAGNLIP